MKRSIFSLLFTLSLFQFLLAQLPFAPAPCSIVKDLSPGSASTNFPDVERTRGGMSHEHFNSLTNVGTFYFSASPSGTSSGQIWETNGTEDGTIRRAASSNFSPFTKLVTYNGTASFFGVHNSGTGFRENLFTSQLGNLIPLENTADCPTAAPAGYERFQPMNFAGKIYYRKLNCNGGANLWMSHGNDAKQITNTNTYPHLLGSYNGEVFFVIGGQASHPGGRELWKFNPNSGLPATLVKKINFDNLKMDYLPALLPGGGTPLLFIAQSDKQAGQALWRTDGTAAGTYEIAPAFGYHRLVSGGKDAYFVGKSATGKAMLMRTNGERATKLTDLEISGNIEDFEMILIGSASTGRLLFPHSRSVTGNELYCYDFRWNALHLIQDINKGTGNSDCRDFTRIGNTIYFTANDGAAGRELWRTDGRDFTKRVQDIRKGGQGSDPQGLIRLNATTLLFTADDGISGRELWKLDIELLRSNDDADEEQNLLAEAPISIQLAPNPAREMVSIRTSDGSLIERFQILSLDGRVVREQEIHAEIWWENIASLPAGMFLLRSFDSAGNFTVARLIKQ